MNYDGAVPSLTPFLMPLDQLGKRGFPAIAEARGGEVFIRNVSTCTVRALADSMYRLTVAPDYALEITLIRPAEKLNENSGE